MNAPDHLRQAIDQQQRRLRAGVPADREAAILALVRVLDQLPLAPGNDQATDLFPGYPRADLGGNTALQLCLEAAADDAAAAPASPGTGWDGWADRFLQACGDLAAAELILAHGETGFIRLVAEGQGTLHAWIGTKRPPTSWRERADIAWWAASLAQRYEPERRALESMRPQPGHGNLGASVDYRRLAAVHVKMMAYQLGYPPDAVIGGCTIQTYSDVLRQLIAWALQARDQGEAVVPRDERSLVAALASALAVAPAIIARAVAGFTVDRETAAWHAAVPGVAAPPLVRIDPERLVWSRRGLTTEPLFFLTRELRRRDAEEYHNSAFLREGVFREDLYALFPDKRFVTSAGRVKLRRDDGDVRTDVDAVVFDRKTGTLALFELKSQDPFARSTAELARQRDNVLYANRQLSGVLAWLQRHGADALLSRVDPGTAKTFRVQKVYPFVLGRYVVHFTDGPSPDRRAAWGTWPQLLRLLDGQPVRAKGGNPLASLSTRLRNDTPLILPPAAEPSREIALGDPRVIVYPSYSAFQASATPVS